MSMPKIPDINPEININRSDAVNLIIASIAMEELSLAHILNAEGEKLQYVLGTLDGKNPGEITLCDIMAVNNSIQKTLRDVIKTEMLLQFKLEDAVELAEGGEECQLTIKGQKIWIDDNAAGRPESVEITLLRNGAVYKKDTVKSTGDGSYVFTCLPIWKNSTEKYTYTVDETVVPAGYKKTVEGFNVINTSLIRTINGAKIWFDEQSPDRPENITVNLFQNGGATPYRTVTVASDDKNTTPFSFDNVPRFDNEGKPFVYTVDEADLPAGYEKKIDGFNITNTFKP